MERLLDEHQYTRTGTGRQCVVPGSSRSSCSAAWTARGPWRSCAASRSGARPTRPGSPSPPSGTGTPGPPAGPARWPATTPTAVILVTSELTPDQLEQLHSGRIPLVVVDPVNPPPPDLASVGATNWATHGLAATEHLLGLGHRRIAAIAVARRLPVQAGPGSTVTVRPSSGISARFAFDRVQQPCRHGDFQARGRGFPVRRGICSDSASRPTGRSFTAATTSRRWAFYEARRGSSAELRIPQDLERGRISTICRSPVVGLTSADDRAPVPLAEMGQRRPRRCSASSSRTGRCTAGG